MIEEMGAKFEEEEESKFRDSKQYAMDAEWAKGRKEFDGLWFPESVPTRPRLGARALVKSYTRRYLPALYKELSDWI